MASFATSTIGVEFDVDVDSYNESREARVAIQDIPGGDDFYVDLAGRGPMRITFRGLFASSSIFGSMMTNLGQQGALSIEGLDTHDVVLMKVGSPFPVLDGRRLAEVEFVVVDA